MSAYRKKLIAALRILCAIAVMSIGFAPQVQAESRIIPLSDLAHYVLPDGTLPELCVTLPGDSGDGKIVRLGCDTLGAHHHDSLAVFPHHGGQRVIRSAQCVIPARHISPGLALYPPGRGPRAPPVA